VVGPLAALALSVVEVGLEVEVEVILLVGEARRRAGVTGATPQYRGSDDSGGFDCRRWVEGRDIFENVR
jgi:hypothetical protein